MKYADERFDAVESNYRHWKSEYEASRLTNAQFEQVLQDAAFEHAGRWWIIGATSGKWYATDGAAWAETQPPLAPPAKQAARFPANPEPVPRSAASPAPSPMQPAPAKARRSTATILAGCMGAFGLLVAFAGLVMLIYALMQHSSSAIIGTRLIAAGILLIVGSTVSVVPPKFGTLLLVLSVFAIVVAFIAGRIGFGGAYMWWLPQFVLEAGIASLLGSILGLVVRVIRGAKRG